MKKKKIQYYLIILFFLMSSMFTYANWGGKGPPLPRPNGPGPYPELPIDGGVSILLIIGTVFGVYELKKK